MGLWDYLTGGNAKVAAGSIARAHRRYWGDYQAVYNEFIGKINAEADRGGPQKKLEVNIAILTIRNYTDLGVLYLYAGAAPKTALLTHIQESFSPKLSRYLRSKRIMSSLFQV